MYNNVVARPLSLYHGEVLAFSIRIFLPPPVKLGILSCLFGVQKNVEAYWLRHFIYLVSLFALGSYSWAFLTWAVSLLLRSLSFPHQQDNRLSRRRLPIMLRLRLAFLGRPDMGGFIAASVTSFLHQQDNRLSMMGLGEHVDGLDFLCFVASRFHVCQVSCQGRRVA